VAGKYDQNMQEPEGNPVAIPQGGLNV